MHVQHFAGVGPHLERFQNQKGEKEVNKKKKYYLSDVIA